MYTKLNRNSGTLLAGVAISAIGDWLNILALMTLFSSSFGPTMVAILMAARTIPSVFLGPWIAGSIDRVNRKKALITLSLIQAAFSYLFILTNNKALLIGTACVLSTLNLFTPALIKSLIPSVCESRDLNQVNSYFNMLQASCYVFIPFVSAGIVSAYGPTLSFQIDSLSFAVFAAMMGAVNTKPRSEKLYKSAESPHHQFGCMELISELRSNPKLLRALSVMAATGLSLGIIYSVEISFFSDILHVDSKRYGNMVSLAGAGVLLGSILCGQFSKMIRIETLLGVGTLVFGLMTFLFSLNRNLPIALGLMTISGIGEGLFSVAGTTLIQTLSPENRIAGNFTLLGSLTKAATLIAMLGTIFLLKFIGPHGLLFLAGCAALITGGLWTAEIRFKSMLGESV